MGGHGGFVVVDHTADLAIVATGGDYGELFANAARGMTALLAPRGVELGEARRLEIPRAEGAQDEDLLVAFLSELLFLHEDDRLVFGGFEVVVGAAGLEATMIGAVHDERIHGAAHGLKAVTYHDLKIRHEGGGLSVRIVFDV